ncbi:Gfo/Idh/MocA family protein [Kineococcus gynurae]|uniref:Gfo/Idh/MocA family protein n=1 Tax=Kineococcus gynurae TaxID=452979 RepID=A0ABV5LN33_9ACTN
MSQQSPLRLGILGLGTISRAVHLPLVARSADVRLVAVADLDPVRAGELAAAYGARALNTEELLQAPDVDAVLVATPGRHAELAVAALRAGKHVLAEKPLALSLPEVVAAEAAAVAAGRVLQVGYMKVHDGAVVAARAALAEIGELRLVQVSVRHPLDAPQLAHLRLAPPGPLPESARPVVEAAEAGEAAALDTVLAAVGAGESAEADAPWRRLFRSVLCGSVVHELSVLRALGLGLPDRPDHAELLAWDGTAPPTLLVTASPAPDVRCILDWAWLPEFPGYTETVRLTGTAGEVELRMAPPYVLDTPSRLTVLSASGGGAREVRFDADGAFQRQLESFVAAVRTGDVHPDATAAGAATDLVALQGILAHLRGRS